MKMVLLTIVFLAALPGATIARVEVQQFASPQDEARYKQLIYELRCLVCQNQNLADSNAELAQTLRGITYDMIREGKTDDEIISFMVQRYGEFVLYRPPVTDRTIMLWAGPFLLLVLAAWVLVRIIRRNRLQRAGESGRDLTSVRRLLEEDGKETH